MSDDTRSREAMALEPHAGLVKIELVSRHETVDDGQRLVTEPEPGEDGRGPWNQYSCERAVELGEALGGEAARLAGRTPSGLVQLDEVVETGVHLGRRRHQL